MSGSAGDRDAVAVACLQIGGGFEASQVGRAGGGYRRILVGAARAHLDNRAAIGSRDHAGSSRGHRGIGVHDGQDDGLQNQALPKGAAHRQDGGVGEIKLALAVAVNLPGKAVVTQVFLGFVIQEVHLC